MRRVLALPLIFACGPVAPPITCPSGILVVTTDEQSATDTGVLPLDGTPAVMLEGNTAFGADPALATSAGRRFLVARTLDTVIELGSCGQGINQQWSARAEGEDAGVNPQDVAVAADGSLWIARLGAGGAGVPSIDVVGPNATTIDLSSFDSDGNPDASSIRIVGGRAFVALERLNPYPTSAQPSQVEVIDTTTRKGVATITLQGRNPFGLMVQVGADKLWLAEPGNFADATEANAGIEVVDTIALKSSLLISEQTLGASVAEIAVGDSCAAAIVADPTPDVNRTSLVSFALDGTNVRTALGPTTGFDLRGLLWTNGKLLVGDKRPSSAGYPVHVFSADGTCALTAGADLTVPDLPPLAFAAP